MVIPDLPDDLVRMIGLMTLQLRYPYQSQAPKKRRLLPSPSDQMFTAALGSFHSMWPRWQKYINLVRENKKYNLPVFTQRIVLQGPISSGWLINALRVWIRRAVNRIARRRLYDNVLNWQRLTIDNQVPTYGVKYPL